MTSTIAGEEEIRYSRLAHPFFLLSGQLQYLPSHMLLLWEPFSLSDVCNSLARYRLQIGPGTMCHELGKVKLVPGQQVQFNHLGTGQHNPGIHAEWAGKRSKRNPELWTPYFSAPKQKHVPQNKSSVPVFMLYFRRISWVASDGRQKICSSPVLSCKFWWQICRCSLHMKTFTHSIFNA